MAKKSLLELEGYKINNTPFRAWLRPYIAYTFILVGASYVFFEYVQSKKSAIAEKGPVIVDPRKHLPYVQSGEFYKNQPDQIRPTALTAGLPANHEHQKYLDELEAMNKLKAK